MSRRQASSTAEYRRAWWLGARDQQRGFKTPDRATQVTRLGSGAHDLRVAYRAGRAAARKYDLAKLAGLLER